MVQTRNELLEVSAAATKYVSNHISGTELSVIVTRIHAADPILWSHEDEFVLQMSIPFPQFTKLIPMPAKKSGKGRLM
ncbi:hypothetical protein [uncultured Brevibacillus sp.]|uniref:hypothetical protein n=1 Tax=uncultured Brevibacillus sp. TaxID=169970 RepID=UPI002598A346|nr:hypothetical protein [uncultured Brevibacillus sp.]